MGKTLIGSLGNAARTLFNRTPVPYTSGRNISIPWRQPTGAEAQMRAMGTVGTLFAIVNRTSNAAALVEWKLYRKAASGLKEDRTEVTTHAALDLWNRPNAFFTRQELVESTQQHIDLTGEGWWVITRNPRSPLPLELWPVRPDRIAPVPHPIDFISGYVYTAPDGREIPLRVEDVIQIRMPNPLDPYRGMGPVQSVLTEIDASKYSAEWNRNFFLNSAEPGGIIQVEKHLQDWEFDEARDRWAEQHKGVSNAHRVAIIENGMKWVDRKLSQRDMQFAELRSVSRDVIREAFGAPAFVLGEVGDVNRATAEASKVLFAEQLTVPRLERFKGALNNDLLPLYGKDAARMLEFDYEDPVPADAAARNAELAAKSTAARELITAGYYGPAVAEAVGLPDIQFGDPSGDPDRQLLKEIVIGAPSTAPLILPMLGFTLPAQPPAVAPAASVPAARLELHHVAAALPPVRHPMYNTARTLPAPLRNAAEDDALEQVREQFDNALADLLDVWEPVAEAQFEQLGAQIEAAVSAGDTEALADLTADSAAGAKVLRGALADMAETASAQMAAEAAEQGVKVRPPKVDKRLTNAFGSELVEVAAVTAGLLAADIAASAGREALRLLTPGAVGREVASQVTGFLRGLKNWFRRDQLGGALHRAQNIGRLATLAAAPPAVYVADERMDSNTCDPCRDIDGTEWTTLAEAQAVYGAGGYLRCEGGIRCRGTITARWDTTEEASMGRTRRCWNSATPEQIAARGRAMRPALPTPDGSETWYRVTNSLDEGGTPVASISIYGDIGSWGISASSFVEELKAIDAPEIWLSINSPGGEVFDGLAIHSALRSHRAKVTVQIDSLAASIASVIAMAGDRIIATPHSQFMVHDAQGVACGSPQEMREYAEFLDRQSDNIASVYSERAGGTVKQWRARMKATTWYFADEAVAAGLADEVAMPKRMMPDEEEMPDDRAIAASWDLSVYNYAHTSREQAPPPPLDATSPSHDTAVKEGEWDKGTQVGRLPSPMSVATARKVYATYDSDRVEDGKLPKDAGHLPHHFVSEDGTPGAASVNGVRAALSSLPKTQGLSEQERSAAETHLRNHLDKYNRDNGGGDNHAPQAVARQFAKGDRVRITVTPHEEGQDAGTVSEVNGNAYGITFDGMEDMGVHRWYTDDELEPESGQQSSAAVGAFDPAVFRAATAAALDPMPGYQPEHLRSLMASVATDAPAAPATVAPEAPYVPPPADVVPQPDEQTVAVAHWGSLFTAVAHDAPAVPTAAPEPAPYVPPPADVVPDEAPQDVAVGYWRSLFTAAANDAPAPPARDRPAPAVPEPRVVYVPEPPPPAGEVVADYFRAVMTGVANDAPAPDTPPPLEPTPPEPVTTIDQTSVRRALWEAKL